MYVLKNPARSERPLTSVIYEIRGSFPLPFHCRPQLYSLFLFLLAFAFCWLTHFSSLRLSFRNDDLFTVYWTTTLWSATVELLLLFGQLK